MSRWGGLGDVDRTPGSTPTAAFSPPRRRKGREHVNTLFASYTRAREQLTLFSHVEACNPVFTCRPLGADGDSTKGGHEEEIDQEQVEASLTREYEERARDALRSPPCPCPRPMLLRTVNSDEDERCVRCGRTVEVGA
jgi:hypothetical protein